MRRIAAALLAAVLAVAGSVLGVLDVFAQRQELVGADMTMRAPDGWLVLTREAENRERYAANFGFTPEEALEFFDAQGFYMALYQMETEAEMYVTLRESTLLPDSATLELLNSEQMDAIKDMLTHSYAGWTLQGEVEELRMGGHTYLGLRMYNKSTGTANRQLFTVYDGYEIAIDAYRTGREIPEDQSADQDALAGSLIVNAAQQAQLTEYRAFVGAMVGLLALLLTQCVGLCMAVFIAIRTRPVQN